MGSRVCGARAAAGVTVAAGAAGGRADATALDATVSDGAAEAEEAAGGALLAAAWLEAVPPPADLLQPNSTSVATPISAAQERGQVMAYLAVIMIDDTQPRLPVSSSTSHHTPFFWPVGKTLSPAWNWRTILDVGEAAERIAMFCLIT